MTTPPSDPMVGRTIAHYDILARIGGGGMGVVYRARDSRLGRTVALKFLPPQWSHDESARLRFMREAQAASATLHPNICTIHDIETADDGQLFIVMAFYEGPTLKQRLDGGPLAVDEALDIASQIADGLARAHAQGVVHRDVKPGNVILTEDGVRVLDFGLATFADAVKLTIEHSTLGTAAYMSPEQVRGESADARSDVWAVGVILYEMLAGHPPFQGSHTEAIAYAVRHETPAAIRAARLEVGEDVEQLVFRAMHKDPRIRFQNGRELARALRQLRGQSMPLDLRTEPVTAPRPVPPPRDDHRGRGKRRLIVAVAIAVGVVTAAVTTWWYWPVHRVSIVVAPVANETGDASLQPYRLALTYALERALSESASVRTVPHTQAIQILRRFLVDGADVSSRDAIQALSMQSGAQVVVVPSLLYENGAMRARGEFLNPATATTIATFETEARSSLLTKDTAADLIDALARGVEERLATGWRATFRSRTISPRFRTLDGMKAFEEGVDAADEFEYSAAHSAFESAAAGDAAPPVASAWVSRVNLLLGRRDDAAKSGATAVGLLSATTSGTDRLFVEAVAAESVGNADGARAQYQALANRFPDEPAWLMELAGFYERQRDSAAAIETYHRALGLDPRLARPHLFLCRLYNSTGTNDPALARQHGEQARDAYRAMGALGGEAQASLCLVDILRVGEANQRAEARKIAADALKIYERLGWPFNLARAYHYAAMAEGKDDIAAAARFWEQSLPRAREVGNGSLEATVLTNLGVRYHELRDIARALDYYRQSYQLYEKRGDARGAAYSRANAGALMVQEGIEPDEGFRYLSTALKVFADSDSNFEMFCRKNLAEYYRHTGQLPLADRELNRAFDLAGRHGLADDMPALLLDRARLRAAEGNYATAKNDLQHALDVTAGPKAETRIDLGLVLTSLGEFSHARQTLGQAEDEIAQGSPSNLEPRLRAALGVLEYESGKWREALADFKQAEDVAKTSTPDAAILEARFYTALIGAQGDGIATARAVGEECVGQAQMMRRVGLETQCRLLLARTAVSSRRPEDATKVLSAIRVEVLGPELQAQVHYWRGRAAALSGTAASAEDELEQARRLVVDLRERIPAESRQAFSQRQEIRLILE